MTDAHWERIDRAAEQVLGTTAGLRASIEERERVAMYWTGDEELGGLVTLDLRHETFEGREVVAIFTGNTWLHPAMRGKALVQTEGARAYAEALWKWPRAKKFWFFGTNSYKSYILLARNFHEYWPRPDRATPTWENRYLCHLTQQIYRVNVAPDRLVYDISGGRSFRNDETDIPPALADDTDVRFFLSRNPNYATGSKLMCLGPLTPTNWAIIAARVSRQARRSLFASLTGSSNR